MGISIELSWVDDPAVESPGPWDVFSFWMLCIHTFVTFLLVSSSLFYSRRYEPLKAKSVGKLSGALICSLVHLWALYVGNEQSLASKQLAASNCSLWNFWFPYFVGLNTWFVFMMERMISYGMLLKEMEIRNHRVRVFVKLLFCIFISMPIFVICFMDSIKGLTIFTKGSCSTALPIKICLLAWVLIDVCFMAVINHITNSKMPVEHLNEFKALRDGMYYGIFALGVFLCIHFTGRQNTSGWRSLQLIVLEIMYMFCFVRIIFYTLVCAITDDVEYARQFRNLIDPNKSQMAPTRFEELLARGDMKSDFLLFCKSVGQFHIRLGSNDSFGSRAFSGLQYVNCIEATQKINFFDSQILIYLNLFMDTYLRENDDNVETRVFVNKNVLNTLENLIVQYEKTGTMETCDFQTSILIELFYILGSKFFNIYKVTRMGDFLQSLNERNESTLVLEALENSGLLLSKSSSITTPQLQKRNNNNNIIKDMNGKMEIELE